MSKKSKTTKDNGIFYIHVNSTAKCVRMNFTKDHDMLHSH